MLTRIFWGGGMFYVYGLSSGHVRARGFSVMELLVVIGVVLVLIGLLLPGLSRSRQSVQRTQRAVNTNQIVALLAAYAVDYQEVFPIHENGSAIAATVSYPRALVRGGYVESERQLDQEGYNASGMVTILLSETVVCKPESFSRQSPQPRDQRVTSPIRWSNVSFPSQKGILASSWVKDAEPPALGFWCCGPGQPKAPVAFADQSVAVYGWDELAGGVVEHVTLNGVGSPVFSTWKGVRRIDR
jgi:type II secretory pathway pseudopilin PulG